jgi:hypothetical protein
VGPLRPAARTRISSSFIVTPSFRPWKGSLADAGHHAFPARSSQPYRRTCPNLSYQRCPIPPISATKVCRGDNLRYFRFSWMRSTSCVLGCAFASFTVVNRPVPELRPTLPPDDFPAMTRSFSTQYAKARVRR